MTGTRVIPVSGCKGGVGKTTLACHLARYLSEYGTVLGVDLDPTPDLSLFLRPLLDTEPSDIGNGLKIFRTQHKNMFVIRGEIDTPPLALYLKIGETVLQIEGLDYSVLDMGAGLDSAPVFTKFATGILVLRPEAASFRDAEIYIRKCISHRITEELRGGLKDRAEKLAGHLLQGRRTVPEILSMLGQNKLGRAVAGVVQELAANFKIYAVLNGWRNDNDTKLMAEFTHNVYMRYQIGIEEPIIIPYDEELGRCIAAGRLCWPLPDRVQTALQKLAHTILQDSRFADGGNRTIFGRLWERAQSLLGVAGQDAVMPVRAQYSTTRA